MIRKLARLFTIKTRLEAFLVTYAIAVGATERGIHYLHRFPGTGGWLLFAACLGTVFIAGAKLLDSVRRWDGKTDRRAAPAWDGRTERRRLIRQS